MPGSIPKVSIVIPVYNGANYLPSAIDCALRQTYGNIEIIVVNDGSTDNGATCEIALSFGDRIRYFEKPNGGVSSALNFGISKMGGDYFSWLSHDDEYGPSKIQEQMQFLQKTGVSDKIVFTDFYFIDGASKRIGSYLVNPANLKSSLSPVLFGFINGCTLLIPRHCFDEAGLFNEKLATTQDYDLWFRMARKFEFVHLPCMQVGYRLHPSQASNTAHGTQRDESDAMYLSFLKELTPAEVAALDGDERKLFIKLSLWLEAAGHLNSAAFVRNRLSGIPGGDASPLLKFHYRHINTTWHNKYNIFSLLFCPILSIKHALFRIMSHVPSAS